VTVLALVPLRSPADFADWYRPGADYVRRVVDGMDFQSAGLADRFEAGEAALRGNETDVSPPVARTVAAELLADAAFGPPFLEWTPLWYELALTGPTHYAEHRLRRVAAQYAASVDSLTVPRASRPKDVLVRGRPATAHVSGFADRFAFADAVLHLEWFDYVASESGVDVPRELLDRTRRETVSVYVGDLDVADMSDDARRLQHLLFTDDEWVRAVDERYGLDSYLFGLWERVLTRERERFA
jgi:hypothetical protein